MSGRDEQPTVDFNCPHCQNDIDFWILIDESSVSGNNWGWLFVGKSGMPQIDSIRPLSRLTKSYIENPNNITLVKCRCVNLSTNIAQHNFRRGHVVFEHVMKEVLKHEW